GFSGNKYDGLWSFYKNDGIYPIKKLKYQRGYLYGEAKFYDTITNTLISKGKFLMGSRIGVWENYYSGSTRIKSTYSYEKGLLHGEYHLYDSVSGNIIRKGMYNGGQPEGKWYSYYPKTG